MVLELSSVGKIFVPIVTSLTAAFSKEVAKELKKNFNEEEMQNELIKAIETGKAESFIKKYEPHLSQGVIYRIRAIADFKSSYDKIEEIIDSKTLTADNSDALIDLTKMFRDITALFPFKKVGIKDIIVQDPETGESIPVNNEDYMIALLLKFTAAIWTQLATKLTPSGKGWPLDYYAEASLTVDRPKLTKFPPPTKAEERLGKDLLVFRDTYLNLMQLYRQGVSIRDEYLEAVACLRAAQLKVKKIQDKQKIHKYMDPSHLEGLATALRGEAQYWQFNISADLSHYADTAINFYETHQYFTKEYLHDYLNVSKQELNDFLECVKLYKNIEDGFAGALKLYQEAAEKVKSGKDGNIIKSRISEIKKLASKNPVVSVPNPKPVM